MIGSSGTLYQTIATTPGDFYNFSFSLYTTDAVPGLDSTTYFRARWDGTEIAYNNITGAASGLGQTFTGLQASGANTQVYFEVLFGNFVVFHIDDVSVTAASVPEPSAYAALLGCVALGVVCLRRCLRA